MLRRFYSATSITGRLRERPSKRNARSRESTPPPPHPLPPPLYLSIDNKRGEQIQASINNLGSVRRGNGGDLPNAFNPDLPNAWTEPSVPNYYTCRFVERSALIKNLQKAFPTRSEAIEPAAMTVQSNLPITATLNFPLNSIFANYENCRGGRELVPQRYGVSLNSFNNPHHNEPNEQAPALLQPPPATDREARAQFGQLKPAGAFDILQTESPLTLAGNQFFEQGRGNYASRRNTCASPRRKDLNKAFSYCDRVVFRPGVPVPNVCPYTFQPKYKIYASDPLCLNSDHNAVVAVVDFQWAAPLQTQPQGQGVTMDLPAAEEQPGLAQGNPGSEHTLLRTNP